MILSQLKYPAILDEICAYLTSGDVELELVDSQTMQEINHKERGIDATTDVLSFPLVKAPHTPLGCVVINVDMALSVAKALGHSQDDEMALLFTHGLLHVLGYDHETDKGQMRQKEAQVMQHFNLPQSLIIRTLG